MGYIEVWKCMLQNTKYSCYFFLIWLVQSQEFFIPSSPSESGSQDSGACVFDYKADGDDDGFIDDFVQEQSKEVHFMCSLFK